MDSRQRVLTTLNHKEPDRIPFDLGGTYVTGINVKAYRALRAHLGLPQINAAMMDMNQQIVWVDDDVVTKLGVDVKNISVHFPSNYRPNILDDGKYTYYHDEFQLGWRMPKDGGFYYDIYDHPLEGNISESDVDAFPWPDPLDPARFIGLREAILRIQAEPKAVTVGFIHAGMMELFAFMRGFSDYFTDFAGNPKLAGKIMDRVLMMQLAYWEKVFEIAGDLIDVALVHDDYAGQNQMLISPRTYRQLCKPRHKQLCDLIHSRSKAKVFLHSCGAIRPVIPDLIEIGVDILNPVQVSATGMDSAELKREYGKDLVFWGGGVDTQNVLGSGTPQLVRDEVKRRITDLMPGGGFVFAAVHNIQQNVPPENILAMWETLQEFGAY
jgi:uroporphyrinogen decarboxylase